VRAASRQAGDSIVMTLPPAGASPHRSGALRRRGRPVLIEEFQQFRALDAIKDRGSTATCARGDSCGRSTELTFAAGCGPSLTGRVDIIDVLPLPKREIAAAAGALRPPASWWRWCRPNRRNGSPTQPRRIRPGGSDLRRACPCIAAVAGGGRAHAVQAIPSIWSSNAM